MQSKLPTVGTTIFSTMSKLALEYNAINLSQGFPNFEVDPVLSELLAKNAKLGFHQYAPMAGNPILLEEIVHLIGTQYKRKLDPSTEVLVTAGATQGIFTVMQALVHAGDEVVILDPAYDCYAPAVALAGGKAVHINLEADFTIDWKMIREVVSQKTKMLLVNTPHNPSGKMLNEDDFRQLEQLLLDHPNLILLSDEVYEYITFEKTHYSAHQSEILKERSVVVSSFGKTFHITGWKVGYCVAPQEMMHEIKKVHQYLVFSVNSIAQQSLAEYMKVTDVTALGSFYKDKRDFFREAMSQSRFEFLPSEGSYFQLAKFSSISDERDVVFCENLAKNHGVAAIPLSPFYKNGEDYQLIRFCFAKTNETLILAAEKLCKI